MISKITVEKKLLEFGVLEPSDSAEEIIAMTKVLVMILPLAEGDIRRLSHGKEPMMIQK